MYCPIYLLDFFVVSNLLADCYLTRKRIVKLRTNRLKLCHVFQLESGYESCAARQSTATRGGSYRTAFQGLYADPVKLYSGHGLRAGLASSAEMARRYQRRRDRFRVNLTKAAGLQRTISLPAEKPSDLGTHVEPG